MCLKVACKNIQNYTLLVDCTLEKVDLQMIISTHFWLHEIQYRYYSSMYNMIFFINLLKKLREKLRSSILSRALYLENPHAIYLFIYIPTLIYDLVFTNGKNFVHLKYGI